MISSDCINLWVVRITRGRSEEGVDFSYGALSGFWVRYCLERRQQRIIGICENFGGGGVCYLAG